MQVLHKLEKWRYHDRSFTSKAIRDAANKSRYPSLFGEIGGYLQRSCTLRHNQVRADEPSDLIKAEFGDIPARLPPQIGIH